MYLPVLFVAVCFELVFARKHRIASTDVNRESYWGGVLQRAIPVILTRPTDVYYYPRMTTNSVECFSAVRTAMKEKCTHVTCVDTFPYFYESTVFGVTTVCVPAERVSKHTPSERLRLHQLNAGVSYAMGSAASNYTSISVVDGRYVTNTISVTVPEIFKHFSLLCDERSRCSLTTPRCLEYMPLVGGSAPLASNIQVEEHTFTVDVPDREDCALAFLHNLKDLSSVPIPLDVVLSSSLDPIFHVVNLSESIIRRGRTDDRCGFQRYNITHVLRCNPNLANVCLWCGKLIHYESIVHTYNISIAEVPYFSSLLHHAASSTAHLIQSVVLFFLGLLFQYITFWFEEYSSYFALVFSAVFVFFLTRFFLDSVQSILVSCVYIGIASLMGHVHAV